MENSRRSTSANSSFGIRASALDFQKDLERRRREREQRYEKYKKIAEETCNKMEEILVEFNREEKRKKIEREENERKEKEEREKEEELKEFERKKSVQEKEVDVEIIKKSEEIVENKIPSEEVAMSNNISPFIDLNKQQFVEDCPKKISTIQLPSLRERKVDIFPSAPMYVQLTFISPIHESVEERAKDCVVVNTTTSQKLFVDHLFLCEEKNLHGLLAMKPYTLRPIRSSNSFVKLTCFARGKNATSMFLEQIKFDFQRFVFDPGGDINQLDSRTNPFEEGGNDMNRPRDE